jgi:hypothetical protein
MIKFFRNIRKKLVEENKTANYLKYANGEIVLVVIGNTQKDKFPSTKTLKEIKK